MTSKRRRRFYRVDVEFFHKHTCDRLLTSLGPWGALAFLSLIAAAKRSSIPGHVVIASEGEFWQQLGLYGHDLPFTMDQLLRRLGELKQTKKTRFGQLTDIKLTRFSEWQQEWRREDDAARQNARRNQQTTRDNSRDTSRTQNVTDLDLDFDLPTEEDTATVTTPKPIPSRDCPDPTCPGTGYTSESRLYDHLRSVHLLDEPDIERHLNLWRQGANA